MNKRKYEGKHKKIFESVLLRESYREGGKVKHRTIANLSNAKPEEIEAIKLALKHKGNLSELVSLSDDLELVPSVSVGAVWALYEACKETGIVRALGSGSEGKIALWQVMARVLEQGSRLSAVRLLQRHAGCEVIGIKEGINEDRLYKNLEWLCTNQRVIEKRLWDLRKKGSLGNLFLYDVTSSYLEGEENYFGEYGYSRDKKRGKKQIVIGLLCDGEGYPVSVNVYKGNTSDFKTFYEQVEKVVKEFGCEAVTFVGDRGMIKSFQTKELPEGCYYISALTKPEIEGLLRRGLFRVSLFDKNLCEIIDGRERYVLRLNPYAREEARRVRENKREKILALVEKENRYLREHKRAKVEKAVERVTKRIEKLKLEKIYSVEAEGRTLKVIEDEEALRKVESLDGCYALRTNLVKDLYPKEFVHDRYKDLSLVEQAFRTMKTGHLELRPVYVRTRESTIGHCFVVMLAYMVTKYLQKAWSQFDITAQEGLHALSAIIAHELIVKGKPICKKIPKPNSEQKKLLDALNTNLPKTLPFLGTKVATRKKLSQRRKN